MSDALYLLASTGLLASPIPAPGFRNGLWLDPGGLFLAPTLLGPIPVGGEVAIPVTLPPSPAIVGLTVFAQTARLAVGANAFDEFVRLPFTP